MNEALVVNNLYKAYHGNKTDQKIIAVNHISFKVHFGEILGILGPNGSGKTSTIKSIASIVSFESGNIEVLGKDIKLNRKETLKQVGAVLEGVRNIYWNLTPTENMIYFASLKGLSKRDVQPNIKKFLEILSLEKVSNKQVKYFSNGMKQKVAIACSLIADPKLVLLDEPTLGLDIETIRSLSTFFKEMAKDNKVFIITSHDMRFIEKTCSRVLVMKNGSIVLNDSIQNLNSYFQKKAFKIYMATRSFYLIENEFNQFLDFRIEVNENLMVLHFVANNFNILYVIFDILKKWDVEIIELEMIKDNLEEIFMSVIQSNFDPMKIE